MLRIYLSGSITNDIDNYKQKFEHAERIVREAIDEECDIVNPAKFTQILSPKSEWSEFMQLSICLLEMCDMIVMLDGWQESRGAKLEYKYALDNGIKVIEFKDLFKFNRINDKIIILCSGSGSGKDTVAREIEKLGYEFLISTTSRPMRESESEGNPYYFTSKENFLKLIQDKQMLEYREYHTLLNGNKDTWYYGLKKDDIKDNKSYIGVLDLQGLKEIKKHFGNRVVSFYLAVPDNERKRRAILRGGFDESEWNRRLETDKKDFSATEVMVNTDFVVSNAGKLEDCVKEIIEKVGVV